MPFSYCSFKARVAYISPLGSEILLTVQRSWRLWVAAEMPLGTPKIQVVPVLPVDCLLLRKIRGKRLGEPLGMQNQWWAGQAQSAVSSSAAASFSIAHPLARYLYSERKLFEWVECHF